MTEKKKANSIFSAGAAAVIKVVFIVVLIVFLGGVYSMNDAKNVPMDDINEALIEKTDLGDLKKCNTRELLEFIRLDYSNFSEVLYYKSRVALDVTELVIIKAKDKNDLNSVEDAIEKRISSQINTYQDYGPKQVNQLKNAVITKRGRYLFYCVAEDPEKYEEVFKNAI